MKPYIQCLIISCSFLLRIRNVPEISVEKKTDFTFNNLFRKSCLLWDNVEIICRAGQATDNNMAHAHCMPDTYGYKPKLGICNICYFYATKVVARTILHVTLYVHCFCCNYLIYSIPFKFVSSLRNQRFPNPLFIPINPLGLLPDFLISSPSLPLVRAIYRVPLKSHVPNFNALRTERLTFPTFTTKFPFCCYLCCVLWPSYDFLINSSLHFITTPYFKHGLPYQEVKN